MTTKHTPGDWDYEIGDAKTRSMSEIFKAGDRTYRIALVNCEAVNPHVRAEDIANVKLLTAAPKLLSSLQRLVEISDRFPIDIQRHFAGSFDEAHAAIAKATGGN